MAPKKNVETVEENISEASIHAASNKAVAEGEKERKTLARSFKELEFVPVSVSPLYMPYFGRVMTVTINGASVAIPCDGKTYSVPKIFADEIRVRISNQDELFAKHRKLGDVSNNFEASPGALQIF